MIDVTEDISIDENEIDVQFVRAGGPGGQHVNKVSTAVKLRFDANGSPSLSDDVRARLRALAGSRMSGEGVITIEASRFRSQKRNREDALERLLDLIRKAAEKPKARRKTRPSTAAVEKRLTEKRHRSAIKRGRRPLSDED